MKRFNVLQTAFISLLFHAIGGIGCLWIATTQASLWFFTVGIYHLLLAILRFILVTKGQRENIDQRWVKKRTGQLLLGSSFPLLGMTILATVNDHGHHLHKILMIAIALYAFLKIFLAILHVVKGTRHTSSITRALRYISLTDAVVSMVSLQRSMLQSFGEMPPGDVRLFNFLTGIAACIFVFCSGLLMMKKPRL